MWQPADSASSPSVVLKKAQSKFISALRRADARKVFASSAFDQSQPANEITIEPADMANYQIVELVTDTNNLHIYSNMQNSDVIYFNTMQGRFKQQLYTQEVKKAHLEDIRRKLNFESLIKQTACE